MLRLALFCFTLLLAPWVQAQSWVTVLDANFDDKPLGQPIGIGGGALGEPIQVTPGLATEVVASAPGRALALTSTNTSAAQTARFELLGSQEVDSGIVRISMQIRPETLTGYQIAVREQGGATSNFLNVNLTATGQVRANWAADSTGVVLGSYTAGSVIELQLVFDMDAGHFTIHRDGAPVLVNQAHGVTNGRGVGRVNVGFGSSAANGGPLRLDRLHVEREAPLEAILAADFNDKPLNQPIGTGGAVLGEPISIDDTRLSTVVVAAAPGRALRITRLDTPGSTSAGNLRFGFIGDAEVNKGPLRIDLLVTFEQLGAYAIRTRERASSAVRWLDLEFSATGVIRRAVRNDASSIVGSYAAGQPLQITLLGNFNELTYRVLLNGSQIDSGSFDANARGVGQLMLAFLSGDANFDKSMVVDDILVQAEPVLIFRDGFE